MKDYLMKNKSVLAISLMSLCVTIMSMTAQVKGDSMSDNIAYYFRAAVIFIIVYLIFKFISDGKKYRDIEKLLKMDERLEDKIIRMEYMYEKGYFGNKDMMYYSSLAVLYYDKGDIDKALELNRKAYEFAESKKIFGIQSKGLAATDVLRLNELTYLVEARRMDEAKQALSTLDENRYKNPKAKYVILVIRAEVAVDSGDSAKAREYIELAEKTWVEGTKEETENYSYIIMQIKAECDVLEGDRQAAMLKLDDIIGHCTYEPCVKRAKQLKLDIEPDDERQA